MTADRVPQRFRQSLVDLEQSVRVPPELLVELQDVGMPGEHLAPEDLDRIRLVASIEGAGRLDPRT